MKKFYNKNLLATIALVMAAAPAASAEEDLSGGFFYLNEDWYGHNNSTINYLRPDDPDGNYWEYRVFKTRNPGKELGCTAQDGIAWGGRLYLIAKQEKDPGASVTGARITVCDYTTMKCIAQLTNIDPSGARCDGRGVVGVSRDKVYISSTNGVWVFDTHTNTITKQIVGTENPNGNSDQDATNPSGALYHGQCGAMVLSGKYVFIAHQTYGVQVVDAATDQIVKTIDFKQLGDDIGVGSLIKDRNGVIWAGVNGSISSSYGETMSYVVRIDPVALEPEFIELDASVPQPTNSWYAWTPDCMCASMKNDYIYWKGDAGYFMWYQSSQVVRFNTVTRQAETIIETGGTYTSKDRYIYGSSMRIHPVTDEIYIAVNQDTGVNKYWTRRYSSSGELLKEYNMVKSYWFPSLPIFTENDDKSTTGIGDITIPNTDINAAPEYFDLQGRRINPENAPAGIYIERRGAKTQKILLR